MEVGMSRGMGKVERQLLEELGRSGGSGVWIAGPGMDRSQVESRRRAAKSLKAKGLAAVRIVRAGRRDVSKLLDPGAALEIDRRKLRGDLRKAKEKKEDAKSEEFRAYRALSDIEPPDSAQGYEWGLEKNKKKRDEKRDLVEGGRLTITISGDDRRVARLMGDIETLLGGIWDLSEPRDIEEKGSRAVKTIFQAKLRTDCPGRSGK